MRDRFSKLHPTVQLLFFIAVLVISMSVNNPFFSAISMLSALLYSIKLSGKSAFSRLKAAVIIVAFTGLFNMLFAHYGEDVLFTLRSVDFTLEALFYGINQGVVLCAVIIWFSALSSVFDSERIIYIFRFAPKCALIFSMVLGFIPRFKKKLEDINDANVALGAEYENNSIKNKLNNSMHILSALVTYSLESSVITANSMSARGYNPKAVRYGRYKYTVSDILLLVIILLLFAVVFIEMLSGNIEFVFEPAIMINSLSPAALIVFVLLVLLPLIIDLSEDCLWRLSSVKN